MADPSWIKKITILSAAPLPGKESAEHVRPGMRDDIGAQAFAPKRQKTVDGAQDSDHNYLLRSLVGVRKSEEYGLAQHSDRGAGAQR
jgi:hypothetical protein